jgi:hypothetical protein
MRQINDETIKPAASARNIERFGWAHFVIDYGPESALLWVVFMDADGACWTVPNYEVRMSFNWTLGRRKPADQVHQEQSSVAEPRRPHRRFPQAVDDA